MNSLDERFKLAATVAASCWRRVRINGLANTYVFADNTPKIVLGYHHANSGVGIQYHATTVAWMDSFTGVLTLRSGGWYTPTTARRMNAALRLFGWDGWRVSRQRGKFILHSPDGEWGRFNDEIVASSKQCYLFR